MARASALGSNGRRRSMYSVWWGISVAINLTRELMTDTRRIRGRGSVGEIGKTWRGGAAAGSSSSCCYVYLVQCVYKTPNYSE